MVVLDVSNVQLYFNFVPDKEAHIITSLTIWRDRATLQVTQDHVCPLNLFQYTHFLVQFCKHICTQIIGFV